MSDFISEFRAAMADAGLVTSTELIADGKLHRFAAQPDKDQASWYVLHLHERFAAGNFGCYRRALNQNWSSHNGSPLSAEEAKQLRQQIANAEAERKTDEQKTRAKAKSRASQIFSAAVIPTSHPYLTRKQVAVHGELRLIENCPDFPKLNGCLALPLRDTNGSLHTLEFIAPDKRFGQGDSLRDKSLLFGGDPTGHFYTVFDKPDGPLVLCEGYATGASIHQATGYATVCARSNGNLVPVALALRKKFPDRTIILAADNDRFTSVNGEPANPGLDAAHKAAQAVKALVVHPEFADEDTTGTDFNDLATVNGLDAVAKAFQSIQPLSFLDYSEILNLNLPAERVFVGDHVICAGNLCSFLAAGGIGKSFLIQQLALSCAAKLEKFLIWDIHPSAHDLRWLIIQQENSAHRLVSDSRRFQSLITPAAWQRASKLVKVLVPLRDQDMALDLDNPDHVHRLRQCIESFNPDVVAFDALYNFTIEELSKGAEMNRAVSNCIRLAKWKNPNRCPILLHHALPGASGNLRAVGRERQTFGRDSKVLHQLSRSVINIIPISEDSNDQLLVSCGKNNDAKEFSPFAIRRNPDSLWFELDDSIDIQDAISKIKNPAKEPCPMPPARVRELCPLTGDSKSNLAKLIIEDCACSRASAYRYIAKALSAAEIAFNPSKQLYFKA